MFKNILNLQNHSSLINHYLRNTNRNPPRFSNKTADHIFIYLGLGKTPSLQQGPWWPPRKQKKTKPKKPKKNKRQQKNCCCFLTLEDTSIWWVCLLSLHWLSHKTGLSLKSSWWSTRVPLVGKPGNILLMTSCPFQRGTPSTNCLCLA